MLKNLLMALAVVVFLTSGLQAQSSKKGSNSNNSASMKRKKDRMMAAEIDKAAKKIAREKFTGIKLEKNQRDTLRELTKANFSQMTSLDSQIGRMIPSNKVKMLQRMYKKALKEGQGEDAAMMTSMKDIELPEMTQKKVMQLSASKAKIVSTITAGVSLTEEQETMLAEKMAMKKDSMEQKVKKEDSMGSGSSSGSGSK